MLCGVLLSVSDPLLWLPSCRQNHPKHLQELLLPCSWCCVARVICGGLQPPDLPAAAQPWVQLKPDPALCTLLFSTPSLWSAVKGASDDIHQFLVIPQETLKGIIQGRRVLGLHLLWFGVGKCGDVAICRSHTLWKLLSPWKPFFLISWGSVAEE